MCTDAALGGMFYNQSCELGGVSIRCWHSEHKNTNDGAVCGEVVCELRVATLFIRQRNVFSKPITVDTSCVNAGAYGVVQQYLRLIGMLLDECH